MSSEKSPSEKRKAHNRRNETSRAFGVSRLGLLWGGATAAGLWKFLDFVGVGGMVGVVGRVGAVLIGLGIIISTFHTPNHLSVVEHGRRLVVSRARQQVMLSGRYNSKKKQPENGTLLGRAALALCRFSDMLRRIPWFGQYVTFSVRRRAEDAVQVKRPFHNSPAVETVDGGVVGALKVRPAAMAVADKGRWKNRVRGLANAIDSSVTSHVQFVSKMRAVDYGDRVGMYEDREQYHLDKLADGEGGIDGAYERARRGEIEKEDLGSFVAADLCDERQEVIDMYDVTTLTRDYYVTMKVTPDDIIGNEYVAGGGGWANVPLLGKLYRKHKLRKLRKEGDHTSAMIDRLEKKLTTLEADLRAIDDISVHEISSTELSQAFADHYKAANAYAIADFGDLVRQSPKPVSSGGESMYGVSHDYLKDDVPDAPLHGSGHGHGPAADEDAEDEGENEGRSPQEIADEIAEINGSPLSDVVVSIPQLIEHFKTLLSPRDRIDRSYSDCITIDNSKYSKTISIRVWPAVPKMGILEPILRNHEPGVAVNLATHIIPIDQDDAEGEIGESEEMRRKKAGDAEDAWYDRLTSSTESEHDESIEMQESMRDSDYDLFETSTLVEVRGDSYDSITRTVDRIDSAMNDEGAEIRPETDHHYEGWQSVSPACEDKIGGGAHMLADGVAREFPWTSRNLHEPNGVEFGTNMHTDEPLYLDLWNRDTGFDFGIFTKKGGGKTTTATAILNRLNMVKGDDVMTIVIDPLQEFANLATVHDGERLVIGGDHGINPFHLEATPEEKLDVIGREAPYKHWMEGCLDFVEMYYADEGMDFSARKSEWRLAIREAGERFGITEKPETHSAEWRKAHGFSGDCPTPLDAINIINEMSEDGSDWVMPGIDGEPSDRKIEHREQSAMEIVTSEVQPFFEGGEYQHFTKQTTIDLEGSTFFYVDMQQQEASTSIGLTMQVVYDLFYELVKTIDIPSVIFMDEFHYMLRDTVAQKSLNQKFRHGRHWDLSLGVATQSFKDFFGEDDQGNTHLTDNASVLFENMPTRIFHREDMSEAWAEELDLSEDEAKFIRNAEPGNAKRGYSTALLEVDKEGTFPLKVKMERYGDNPENPREAVVAEYDPSEHGEDFYAYLHDHDDECEWRFTPPKGAEVVDTPTIKATEGDPSAPSESVSEGPSGRATEIDDARRAETEAADMLSANAADDEDLTVEERAARYVERTEAETEVMADD